MTGGTAPPPSLPPSLSKESSSSVLSFDIDEFVDAPAFIPNTYDPKNFERIRKDNDDSYRTSVTPTAWHRYVQLGYYALSDGKTFDTEWQSFEESPLRMHRLIWYNYMFHVDRQLDLPLKLNAWATQVSQPYLQEHDTFSLDMDTINFAWATIIVRLEKKQTDATRIPPIGRKKESRPDQNKSVKLTPGTPKRQHKAIQQSSISQFFGKSPSPMISPPAPPQPAPVDTDSEMLGEEIASQTHVQPMEVSPRNSPEFEVDTATAAQSIYTNSQQVQTNDGTHRISFRWTVKGDVSEIVTTQRDQLFHKLHTLLSLVFQEKDGKFYRWGADKMHQEKTVLQLTSADLRDY